jgi:hypothetical protein
VSRKGPRPLSLTQQGLGIRRLWPGEISIRSSTLTWVGQLQPTAVSPSYKVRLAYRTGDVTRVRVLDPVLDPGHRDRLPHVYNGDRLCLYTPGEWDRSMQIATTIIPWTAEWLFHYEVWKATDHWAGGGDVYAPSRPEGHKSGSARWLR